MKKQDCEKAGVFGMCPFVTAQHLLSGKWAILILQKLADGPKRFGALQRQIDITQATLSNQLKHLEGEGLIHREVFAEVPPRVEYSLTPIGEAFRPVLESIETWGNAYIAYLKEKTAH
ncbi:winged helix-turn-helix transcriptional regulator [Pseudoramibacter porci]|uniref:Helix-turn-helix transcriptional regulator n=1 Tax=Pseudoramibacter porci TaxID=2606631 RepID=A0A7X2TA98_9FIRM|nr:helix-turn-helix domain-containing protein [Pseudoramibacter porci]MSS20212.1 helix-turn-helix transcriptional regulator [Pseudoramibacter porci]